MSVQGLASGYTILQSLFSSTAPTAADSSTSATVTPTPTLSPVDQFKSDLQALFSAVQQGDMTGAQSALQAITNDVNAAQAGGQQRAQAFQQPVQGLAHGGGHRPPWPPAQAGRRSPDGGAQRRNPGTVAPHCVPSAFALRALADSNPP